MVTYVRSNFYAGEQFRDLDDCRNGRTLVRQTAGMRIHGTTRLRPAEVFATDELPQLKPVPTPRSTFGLDAPKVAPDRHVQVARRFTACRRTRRQAHRRRADAHSVKLYWRGELIKVHPLMAPVAGTPTPLICRRDVDLRHARHHQLAAQGRCHGTTSASTPPQCWSIRCRGPRCARSTGCSAWCAATAAPRSRTLPAA